jgi:hypothetical protein
VGSSDHGTAGVGDGPAARSTTGLGTCSVPTRQGSPEAALQASPPEALTQALRNCGELHAPSGAHLTVRFVVGEQGCVKEVEVRSDGAGSALEGCVAEAFRALRFGAPQAGEVAAVRFPVTLRPVSRPDGGP